jgi:TadE-like protein
MRSLFKNSRGATAVEFALVSLPVLLFITGMIQTAYIIWADNLLNIAVHAAARCGGVGSTTLPCYGGTPADIQSTANLVFRPLTGATFMLNSGCVNNDTGLVGTYKVSIIAVVNLTLTAKSCYPII